MTAVSVTMQFAPRSIGATPGGVLGCPRPLLRHVRAVIVVIGG